MEHMARMRSVCGSAYATGDKDNTRGLGTDIQTTSAPLSSRQIAFAKSAKATEVTIGHVKGLIPV
jgi:hypothetical protein